MSDKPIGRIMTADEAIWYFQEVGKAEKVMGPLSDQERLVILSKVGTSITEDDLLGLLKEGRALYFKSKVPPQ